jgi:hypothetical protein
VAFSGLTAGGMKHRRHMSWTNGVELHGRTSRKGLDNLASTRYITDMDTTCETVELAQCSICEAKLGEAHNIDAHDLDELRQQYREYEEEQDFPF